MIHQVDRNGLRSIRSGRRGPVDETQRPIASAASHLNACIRMAKEVFTREILVQVLSEICLQDYKIVLGD